MLRNIFGILIFVAFFGHLQATAQELTIITEENPPFNFTKDGQPAGATTEVVQEIMHRLGVENTIIVLPWARGYKRLQTEANIALYTYGTDPRKGNAFQWVGPLYASVLVFYARKGSGLEINSLADAKKVPRSLPT